MTATAFSRGERGVDVRAVSTIVVALLAVAGALALWAVGLRAVDLAPINDLGLISVLPPVAIAGPLLLTVSFIGILALEPHRTWLLTLHVIALIVMLYATPAIVEAAPRFNVAWRHVGIAEVLMRTGRVDPSIDAYFSWPGFFMLSAFLTEIAGLGTGLDLVAWAPAAFNLLYLAPLMMIFRAASGDWRVVWLAAWIFYITNWIGQDYFSPQAYAYFLYLIILGVLLTWFVRDPRPIWPIPQSWFVPPERVTSQPVTPVQRATLIATIVLCFVAVVVSHQLTPFAILGVVGALVILRRIVPTGLPIVMVVVLGTWLSYMTTSYLQGNLREMVERIGSVDQTVAANLTDRFTGSPEHILVLTVRSVTTLVLWSLAGIGVVRRRFGGDGDLTWAFLAAAPFVLFLLQAYGGEVLLRIYIFSLPFMSVLAANGLVGYRFHRRAVTVGLVTVFCIGMLAAFFVSRYGNERMDLITATEVAGMEQLYEVAPPDSLLVAVSDNVFWRFKDYELYDYAVFNEEVLDVGAAGIVARMREDVDARPSFLVLSRAQKAAMELRYGYRAGEWDELVRDLEATPGLERIFANEDVQIYELIGPGERP
jgi:hypothetical protein